MIHCKCPEGRPHKQPDTHRPVESRKAKLINNIIQEVNLIRIHLSQTIAAGTCCINDQDIYHYLCHIMRIKIGQTIRVFNAHDGEWSCQIIEIKKKDITLEIKEQVRTAQLLLPIRLGFCLLKPDAMHMVFEKGTELGVTEFLPIISEYTSVKKFNQQKYTKIVTHSSQQCERLDVPTIHEPISFKDFTHFYPDSYVAVERSISVSPLIPDALPFETSPTIMIGPEGGWSTREHKIIDQSMKKITLGKSILRSETAAICAVFLLSRCRN